MNTTNLMTMVTDAMAELQDRDNTITLDNKANEHIVEMLQTDNNEVLLQLIETLYQNAQSDKTEYIHILGLETETEAL